MPLPFIIMGARGIIRGIRRRREKQRDDHSGLKAFLKNEEGANSDHGQQCMCQNLEPVDTQPRGDIEESWEHIDPSWDKKYNPKIDPFTGRPLYGRY